jgi:hypothetical protein
MVADELEMQYECLDDGRREKQEVMDDIEVWTVRYRQALQRLQRLIPSEMTKLVLEPQMANEANSMPCPYGFGRIVRWPWALHIPQLGFCGYGCYCDVLCRARADVVDSAGLRWYGFCLST